MAVLYSNNATTSLSSGITNSATSITVGSVADFPSLSAGEYYFATLANVTNTKIEIVKVTSASSTTLTVVRGQDGTTAVSFDSGDNFQLRVTAATLDSATRTDVSITGGSVATSTITDATSSAKGLATAAQITKLDAIEASADVTDATNVTAAGALMDSELAGLAAVKATTGTFLTADQTKLDGIEASADVTDVTNVTAAGALMDSEVTNLADVKAFDTTDYATAAQGTTADSALPKSGGAMTGAITTNSTFDGRDVATDGTKLDGIESGATADQTNAQIKTAYEANTNTNEFSDAEQTKLSGIATSANNYSHPTHPGDDFSIDTGHLSGATVIDDIDINVTTDSLGHVTDANGTVATRNLTLSDLGYSGATNANYITNNNQLTNGAGYITSYTNTTYSADGNYGMTLSGTTFRLEDDRRRNSSSADVYSGNTHDYTFYDASHGIRWYTSGSEEMRLEDDGDLHVDGNVTAYSTTVSDRNLKTDIKNIDNALEKVNKLNGCTFTYTSDGKESAGLIAQDVEEVLPSAVTTSKLVFHGEEGKEYKVLQYDQTIGLLVEAVKELSAKVEQLENK